ncbi:MAG: hypothetical protein RRZ84_08705 [Romboutsia sp.]
MKKMVKRIIAMFSLFALLFTSTVSAASPERNLLSNSKNEIAKYEVYNGFGELMYTADSLEDAEEYLDNNIRDTKDGEGRGAYKVAKTLFKIV